MNQVGRVKNQNQNKRTEKKVEPLPLTFPMVSLELRPMMGSVATPESFPFSAKEEERRQAVPTCPGWGSHCTTCSPMSS